MSSLSGLSEFEEKDSRLDDHFSEKNDPMDVE